MSYNTLLTVATAISDVMLLKNVEDDRSDSVEYIPDDKSITFKNHKLFIPSEKFLAVLPRKNGLSTETLPKEIQ